METIVKTVRQINASKGGVIGQRNRWLSPCAECGHTKLFHWKQPRFQKRKQVGNCTLTECSCQEFLVTQKRRGRT